MKHKRKHSKNILHYEDILQEEEQIQRDIETGPIEFKKSINLKETKKENKIVCGYGRISEEKYVIALERMKEILQSFPQYINWVRWIEQDIILWNSKYSVKHHVKAYEGFDSLRDVEIDNADFTEARKICYQFATEYYYG